MNIDTIARISGDVVSPTSEQLTAGRHRLEAAISAADVRVAAVRRGRRPRRWGISALSSVAAACAAVLVGSLLSVAPASAEGVLLAAADAAGGQADEAADAAYWHVTSEVDYPDTEPFRREIWQSRTGEAVLRDEMLAAQAAAATGAGTLDTSLVRTESLGQPATFDVAGEPLTWADLDELPTDAAALKDLLSEKVSDHPSGEANELWESITGLLRESPASPALRRALWQVAASMPDVELLGAMTDSVGREGTAIERNQLDQGWYRVVYILDPTDGTLLESRAIDADGTIAYRSTELTRGASATAPSPDAPPCGPGSESGQSC